MPEYQAKYTIPGLLARLQSEGHLEDREKASEFIRKLHTRDDPPLYLRALIGLGAFFSSLFLLGFLFTSELIDDDGPFLVWGLVFIAAAFGLWKRSQKESDASFLKTFLSVLSFTWMSVGKTLFVLEFAEAFDEWGVFFGLGLITGATYFIYRLMIDRFLSCLGVCCAFTVAIFEEGIYGSGDHGLASRGAEYIIPNGLSICGLATLEACLAAYLLSGRVGRKFLPMACALVGGLAVNVFLLTVEGPKLEESSGFPFVPVLGLLLAVGLIALTARAAGGRRAFKSPRLLAAMLGTLACGFFISPGILLGVCLLVYGYGHHDRLLTAFGGLVMPVFLFLWYYDMELTLTEKSAVLAASGLAMLAGRFLFCRGEAGEEADA